jgi:hypothetical protein
MIRIAGALHSASDPKSVSDSARVSHDFDCYITTITVEIDTAVIESTTVGSRWRSGLGMQ